MLRIINMEINCLVKILSHVKFQKKTTKNIELTHNVSL